MKLTVTEREHWCARIKARFNKKIEALELEKPKNYEELLKKSRNAVYKQLGVDKLQAKADSRRAEIEKLEAQIEKLSNDATHLDEDINRKVLGLSPRDNLNWQKKHQAQDRINGLIKVAEEAAIMKTSYGKTKAKLEAERDSVTDAVWLATSSPKIAELWNGLGPLLSDEPDTDVIALSKTVSV